MEPPVDDPHACLSCSNLQEAHSQLIIGWFLTHSPLFVNVDADNVEKWRPETGKVVRFSCEYYINIYLRSSTGTAGPRPANISARTQSTTPLFSRALSRADRSHVIPSFMVSFERIQQEDELPTSWDTFSSLCQRAPPTTFNHLLPSVRGGEKFSLLTPEPSSVLSE